MTRFQQLGVITMWAACLGAGVLAQTGSNGQAATPATAAAAAPAGSAAAVMPPGVTPPADYVIGPEDILTVVFWRDKDMTGDVSVRPDGKITMPLVNDVQAAGLTPEQLRVALTEAAGKFVEEPSITIVVKQINSRKVYITGQVNKPGTYPLSAPTTVLQLIATAGGVVEYAHSDKIVVMRTEAGKSTRLPFHYENVIKGKSLQQNVLLRPGDTVIVP